MKLHTKIFDKKKNYSKILNMLIYIILVYIRIAEASEKNLKLPCKVLNKYLIKGLLSDPLDIPTADIRRLTERALFLIRIISVC